MCKDLFWHLQLGERLQKPGSGPGLSELCPFLSGHALLFFFQLPGGWGSLAGDGVHGWWRLVRCAQGSVPGGRPDGCHLSGGEGSRLCFSWPA